MKVKTALLLALPLIPLGALGLGFAAARMSHGEAQVGLEDGRLQPCPEKPNCVCSEDPREQARIDPIAFQGDPQAAFQSLLEFLTAQSNTNLVEVADGYVHAVFYTPFLKFADDVEFRLDAADKQVHVRSASRIGHSDLGTNRARIEDLRRRWVPASD